MFTDKVKLSLIAGRGGNGVIAWRREKFVPKGGPCGGDGGKGGSIYLEVDPQVVSLEHHRNHRIIKAKNGQPGGANLCKGKSGEDIIVKIPPGTLVKDVNTGEVLYDFVEQSRSELMCKGGRGGKGNNNFKTPTNQAPYICTEGTLGESLEVELELKLIADVGLVGMPNAGKSSLMSAMTHVEVKIGAYPFTTLFPNLSYIYYPEQEKVLVADIPGIIEGAHKDRGLGFEFLRHIERSAVLIYVVDSSGIEERDPLEDFRILQEELRAYNPELLNKPYLVALNKTDIEESKEHIARFKEAYPNTHFFPISALQKEGIKPLTEAIYKLVKTHV
ncbi:GTPase ObgE [Rhabdochlamydiaceae symbiont of Dictyostelium giganteum]|uniref:GTPase ObgE n=1 Tax=Rhabdochlamydiaceae symbiont of Dictyostelium giganteum TaxID=3342349 RepID=UPI00384C0B23